MKRALGILAASTLAAGALGQGISLKAGYYSGESFSGAGGSSVRIEGLELGADLTVLRLPLAPVEVRLSPSVVFGGGLRQGGDDDGTIYRLLATARVSRPGGTGYLSGGLGFARIEPRGGAPFESKDGFVGQIALGSAAANVAPLVPQPFFEVAYTFGDAEFRGFTLSLGVRL
ncbi:MAG: hypothetical protein ACK41F_09470 [Fimbriimonadaceae bacterium]